MKDEIIKMIKPLTYINWNLVSEEKANNRIIKIATHIEALYEKV